MNEHEEILKEYTLHRKLGEGTFGVVRECVQKSTGSKFAIKIIIKESLNPHYLEDTRQEARICSKLKHPNIVRLHKSIEGIKNFYLIFDLVIGGELHDEIVRRSARNETYTEADASYCMQQILEAINFCHKNGIVHFDLKPGNILLASNERRAAIKIADFGLSFVVVGDERVNYGYSGTYIFMPPEVIGKKRFGKPVDIWSCGVIMYSLLSGDYPFFDNDLKRLKEKIKMGTYDYPPNISNKITPLAKDLIAQMMHVDSNKRFTSAQALKHSWISARKSLVPRNHLQETVANLKIFNARRKFKAGILATMAAGKFARNFSKNSSKKDDGISFKSSTGSIKPIKRPRMNDSIMDREHRQQEIITLTEELIDACSTGDSRTIAKLCSPNVTTFQQNGSGKLMKGKDFQRFCFENSSEDHKYIEIETTVLDPNVHLLDDNVACIAYIRLTKCTSLNGRVHFRQRPETCVWHQRNGQWKNVHFHCGRSIR